MNAETYMKESARTESPNIHLDQISINTIHGITGISTEAGELLDAMKKSLFYGSTLDRENVREELGDLLWYVALVIRSEGWSFEDIMEENIAKLKVRYPEQFTNKAALDRADKKEEV